MHLLWRDHRSGDFRKSILPAAEVNWNYFALGLIILVVHIPIKRKGKNKMNWNRTLTYLFVVVCFGILLAGCHPKIDTMAQAEKGFVKMVDKTAAKLQLNQDQKILLEKLKLDIRKNFQEGGIEKKEAMLKIKGEGTKENPDIGTMTSLLQASFRGEAERINRAFDLMLDFQKNLNDDQKQKLNKMISDWVAKWD